MKKKLSMTAAVAVVGLALSACGDASGSGTSSATGLGDCTLTGEAGSISLTTETPDALTVATVLPNPGWWNGTSPSNVKDGFEYCLAANIAHRAGLESVKLKTMAWDQYISGTASGYDIGLATTTITTDREKVFAFSHPYFTSNLGVAVQADANITAENIRDVNVGVLQGNVGAQWVADTLKPAQKPATFQSQEDMFAALSAGQIDAAITDTTLALTAVKASSGALVVQGQFVVDQNYGVVMPLDSKNKEAVDKAVDDMTSDGTLDDLSATYLKPSFGVDPNEVPTWNLG